MAADDQTNRDTQPTFEGVVFKGAKQSKEDFLDLLVRPLLQSKTFGELTQSITQVGENFNELELFKDLRFVIEQNPENESNIDKNLDLIVKIEVKERRYKIHAGTELQQGDIGMGAGGTIYNVLGRGEKLEMNAALGTQTATPFSIVFRKAVQGNPNCILNLACFRTTRNFFDELNYKSNIQGVSASYSFLSSLLATIKAKHDISYSLDWRHIFSIKEHASPTIRRSAGHSIKSSLSHAMTISTLNSFVFPSRGHFIKLTSEVAGFGGSVNYLKSDLSSFFFFPIYKQLVAGLSLRMGHIRPLLGQSLSFQDKFQLGGPFSVRGFALNSIGPKDRNDAIGGDMVTQIGLGLNFPLSSGTSQMVRAHFFANNGSLIKYDQSLGFFQNVATAFNLSNLSVGTGLQVKIAETVKLEFNLAYPIFKQPSAIFKRGLQFGLGFEFS